MPAGRVQAKTICTARANVAAGGNDNTHHVFLREGGSTQRCTMRTLIASSAFAALLLAAPSVAMAQAEGTMAFCLKKANSQSTSCAFQTMAQCERSKESKSDLCSPRSATTGSGPQTPPKTGGTMKQ
jgi:hypothetical protein